MDWGADIVAQLVGYAALGGAAWWRLKAVERAVSELRGELAEDITENNDLIRVQNSRIDKLERWRERRAGFEEGYDQARGKYK